MARPEEPPSGDRPPPGPGPRTRWRWWAAALALLLLLTGGAATVGSGKPFALSILDGLVLVAFAVVAGTYVILARADRAERKGAKAQGAVAEDGSPKLP